MVLLKSTFETYESKCFDNVFLVENRTDVVYAHYSRLEADFKCMKLLLDRNKQWK